MIPPKKIEPFKMKEFILHTLLGSSNQSDG